MSQLFTIGRVITDPELKNSAKQNPYLRFVLMERVGYGEQAHVQTIQVWAWGQQAQQLGQCRVRNGSLIWVSGSLELEEYVKKDGYTRDKRLKLKLRSWGFVPTDKASRNKKGDDSSEAAVEAEAKTIDGEREPLPE